jgi:hypothetical protein
MFSLSTDQELIKLFTRGGFDHHGQIRDISQRADIVLPNYVRSYPHPDRNPHVFTYRELVEEES